MIVFEHDQKSKISDTKEIRDFPVLRNLKVSNMSKRSK